MFSLEKLVKTFIDERRSQAKDEMKHFVEQKTITCAIRKAALCLTEEGKRHPHQYRIPGESLSTAEHRLQQSQGKIRKCKTFDELHSLIESMTMDLWGVGELAVYDISTRIGAYLGIQATKIYLHRGTREGAEALGFNGEEPTIEISQLPPEFSKLKPYEIEDCLCIYKDDLKTRRQRNESK